MATKKAPGEALGKALVSGVEEATVMSQALITHLLGTVAKDTELTEAERAHVSAAHVLCVLGVVNDHLARIGEANFEVCLRQAQALIERERVGGTKVAGLAKLSALLLPLTPLKATLKN